MGKAEEIITIENKYCAQNYHPLPVVLSKGDGVWLYDIEGKKYLDMMSAYSAVSFGHSNPKILSSMMEQAQKLSVCSRAFHSETLHVFLEKLCKLTKLDKALPMNSGAEAVETAIKAARRWGYRVKGISQGKAEIIVTSQNFHGRTIGIISFSSEQAYKSDFGPFLEGFKAVPFNDSKALEEAITENTCAVITEPMQGEAGIVIPDTGWLSNVSKICKKNNVLLILDEIQTGLGRTGAMFAADHENVQPDGFILGKALGGGVYPVSAFVAKKAVMDVFDPGSHGSTFGGNPLAAAIGSTAIDILNTENLHENSRVLGDYFIEKLKTLSHPAIVNIRGKGLWIGLELNPKILKARKVCEALMTRGVLSKETHEVVVRFAPPLIITREQIDWAFDQLKAILNEL